MKGLIKLFVGTILISIVLSCCNRKSSQVISIEYDINKSERKIEIATTDTFILGKGHLINFQYFHLFADEKGHESILIANSALNSLDIYSMSTGEQLWSRSLDSLNYNPDACGIIRGVFWHKTDSIFILSEYCISIFDGEEFRVIKPLNDKNARKWPRFIYENIDFVPFVFDSLTRRFLIRTYCAQCSDLKQAYYTSPIESGIHLDSERFDHFEISYPERYSANYYGFATHIYRDVHGQLNYYSFSGEPNLYIYDRSVNSTLVKGGRSRFHIDTIQPVPKKHWKDGDFKYRHWQHCPLYGSLLIDQNRSLVYRFFLNSIPERNMDGTYNSFRDKQDVLMVFDKELNLIEEYDLGIQKYSTHFSFVGPNGLYLKLIPEDPTNFDKFGGRKYLVKTFSHAE